ncbi:MAG: hypothetical protein KAT66_00500 [Candidatus Lokiarchaeota archaeon]|nr:hypothetical protein [Candidatus Lokiarchaeota archaeon]
MKVEKIIHKGFEEWEHARNAGIELPRIFGKYQYIYSSKKGKISLIKLENYGGMKNNFWEIYCLGGDLINDIERFDTKEEAEKRIKILLDDRIILLLDNLVILIMIFILICFFIN